MKTIILIIFTSIIQASVVFAQNCNLPVSNGQKYMLSNKTYNAPIDITAIAKFTKMKEAKRQAMIDKHNDAIAAGKAKPKSTFDVTYTVEDLVSEDDYLYAKMVTNINGKDYFSHMICQDDSLYLMRKEGRSDVYDHTGKFIGYNILGTQVLPLNIKVGDKLMPYTDNMFSTSNNVLQTNKVNSVSKGSWKTTVTYSTHDVLEISNSTTETINYAFAEVTGTKEFTMNGKTYTAYVIESETWTKTTTKKNFKSLDGEINAKKMTKKFEKFGEKIQKKVDRATLANENGYIAVPKTEWYVPELGVVNLVAKFYGFVTSETRLVGIE